MLPAGRGAARRSPVPALWRRRLWGAVLLCSARARSPRLSAGTEPPPAATGPTPRPGPAVCPPRRRRRHLPRAPRRRPPARRGCARLGEGIAFGDSVLGRRLPSCPPSLRGVPDPIPKPPPTVSARTLPLLRVRHGALSAPPAPRGPVIGVRFLLRTGTTKSGQERGGGSPGPVALRRPWGSAPRPRAAPGTARCCGAVLVE